MRIMQVIHGYPPRYNAGSEVYTQLLARELAKGHEVHVFVREENNFAADYTLRRETDEVTETGAAGKYITLHVVNNPRNTDRYRVPAIDARFAEVLAETRPDLVHVQHLNHLSTSLLREAVKRKLPIVFTLHDYWLMCPRGQFIQRFPMDLEDIWALCDGQEDQKCAERCYVRSCSGAPEDETTDFAYWRDWVARRMRHIHELIAMVDLFIAPARDLHDRFRDHFALPAEKLVYLDYGFARERLRGRQRATGEDFTFGYIGTHIPAKGIHQLIQAFGKLADARAQLRIWGRPRGQDTAALQRLAEALPPQLACRVEWLPEYRNEHIVEDVFNRVDAIVTPSIWLENSPLVIHEAQQARVPVITAAAGGMAEYVQHEVNGLLFRHRSTDALAEQMQRLVDDPALAERLGQRGYLQSVAGDVPSIKAHAHQLERLYQSLSQQHRAVQPIPPIQPRTGPWRITFDTNPDTCNMHCIMCEEHSPFSPLQEQRKAEGRPPRMMPIELIERVIKEAAPLGLKEIVPSTMGEPLLYPDFERILALCAEYGVKLNLTTNGTFPRLGARAWAMRIVPLAIDVKISWNGANKSTQEQIMLGSNWARVLQNVRDFIAIRDDHAAKNGHRCRVTFQLTFLESNVAELADIVKLAIDLGVDRVKGHHLWAHFDQIKSLSMRRDKAAIHRWNAAVREAEAIADHYPLPSGERILLENIAPLDEAHAMRDIAPGGSCPFLGQEVWVSTEGRFNPCCAPDADRQTLGAFGNLHEQDLMDIWQGKPYHQLIESYHEHPLCQRCNMRKPLDTVP